MPSFHVDGGRGVYVVIEPGDATRYEFSVVERGADLFVAGNLCRGTLIPKEDVRRHGPELAASFGGSSEEAALRLGDYYIGDLREAMGDGARTANPWTVRAAVIAAWFVLRGWDERDAREKVLGP